MGKQSGRHRDDLNGVAGISSLLDSAASDHDPLDGIPQPRHSCGVTITIDLEQMTVPERVHVMEQLWDSLLQDHAHLESPAWHRDVLEQRRQRIESGAARFLTIEELKKLKSA